MKWISLKPWIVSSILLISLTLQARAANRFPGPTSADFQWGFLRLSATVTVDGPVVLGDMIRCTVLCRNQSHRGTVFNPFFERSQPWPARLLVLDENQRPFGEYFLNLEEIKSRSQTPAFLSSSVILGYDLSSLLFPNLKTQLGYEVFDGDQIGAMLRLPVTRTNDVNSEDVESQIIYKGRPWQSGSYYLQAVYQQNFLIPPGADDSKTWVAGTVASSAPGAKIDLPLRSAPVSFDVIEGLDEAVPQPMLKKELTPDSVTFDWRRLAQHFAPEEQPFPPPEIVFLRPQMDLKVANAHLHTTLTAPQHSSHWKEIVAVDLRYENHSAYTTLLHKPHGFSLEWPESFRLAIFDAHGCYVGDLLHRMLNPRMSGYPFKLSGNIALPSQGVLAIRIRFSSGMLDSEPWGGKPRHLPSGEYTLQAIYRNAILPGKIDPNREDLFRSNAVQVEFLP